MLSYKSIQQLQLQFNAPSSLPLRCVQPVRWPSGSEDLVIGVSSGVVLGYVRAVLQRLGMRRPLVGDGSHVMASVYHAASWKRQVAKGGLN